jgi:hypothetical protein
MIYLYKGQSNTVVLTLNEKATNTSYDVLFEFINETTGATKLFTAQDTSSVERYNEFVITESDTENLYNGTVKLESGQWKYTVYEMPLASPNSITKSDNVGTLEIGRVTVCQTVSTTTFDENETKNTVTFE